MSDVKDTGLILMTFSWKLKYDETPMAFVKKDPAVMKTLFDAQKWCESLMPSAFERFADNNTTSGEALSKFIIPSLGSCCWSAPVRRISY